MKSIYHGNAGANAKLRGKKFAVLTCRCCCLINIKDQVREKEAKNEIRAFLSNKEI